MSASTRAACSTDGVDQHPHCVLLLDEIEKAHPDLFNILLQVMDHGKLTDHNGKQVDFRNVILIMTTNAGAADLAQARRSASARRSAKATTRRRSTACSRRSSATGSTRSSRSATCRRRSCTRWCRSSSAARGAARRPRRHLRPLARRRSTWLAEKGYDEPHGRPAARPRHPGAHQAAARRRGAVRQAQEGRHGQGHGQGRRRRPQPRGARGRAGEAEARAAAEAQAGAPPASGAGGRRSRRRRRASRPAAPPAGWCPRCRSRRAEFRGGPSGPPPFWHRAAIVGRREVAAPFREAAGSVRYGCDAIS